MSMLRLIQVIMVTVCLSTNLALATLTPRDLRCEYLRDPLGLDEVRPRLSWIVTSAERGAVQTAYQIQMATDPGDLDAAQALRWDSGRVTSGETVGIRYAGPDLVAEEQLWWRVRVWDGEEQASRWSEVAKWEMGLLAPTDWKGKWIARAPFAGMAAPMGEGLPLLRKSFRTGGEIRRARLYVVGLGYHEVSINGKRVGDHLLDPGFTRYDRRALAVTHDVTEALQSGGDNVIGVMLGNGWFNVESLAVWMFDQAPWRASPRLLLQLQIDYVDGTSSTVVSDETWRTAAGPIVSSSIYGGEVHDARREQPGWDRAAFDDGGWDPAQVVDAPHGKIASQSMHPIRLTEILEPAKVTQPAPGVWVYDFGQNLVGNAEIALAAPAGSEISLRYGEVLDEAGRVDQSLLDVYLDRRAKGQRFQTDTYVTDGTGVERWASRFTYHGFRYVEVTGAPGTLDASNLTARFFHSDVPDAGTFSCSDPVLNRVWINGRWSYLGNLMSIPTDCPHREKNGWTGDAHIACEQGLFYQDGITVYEKWLDDLTDEQFIDGGLPGIVPTSGQWGYRRFKGPAWDSALLLIPWYLYVYYGDDSALRANYDAFKRYVDFLTAQADDGIVSIGLPDWSPWKTKTPEALTDTAYYYQDARLVSLVAGWLGKRSDAETYERLAVGIKEAFNREFYDPDQGTYGNDSQTSLGAALYFDLVPDDIRTRVLERLENNIRANDEHLDFGHLGSKFVFTVLADHGRAELAHRMITQPTKPSYAWQIAQGATTLWERWEPTFSKNHTFFGDVNAWMMKHLAGIRPDPSAPGFARVLIAPNPVGNLTAAEGRFESVRGAVSTAWTRTEGSFTLRVSLPANTRGRVTLPVPADASITEGGVALREVAGVTAWKVTSAGPAFELGSGDYVIEARWSRTP